MAFNIPNQAAAAYSRQAGIYATDINSLVGALAGDGVLTGLGCTAQASPNMTVAVAAGSTRTQGYFPFFSVQNATISAADSTNPRYDLISADYNGGVTVTAGTTSNAPILAALPANSIPLAAVYVPAGTTSIGSSQIIDKRVLVPDSFDLNDEFMPETLFSTGNVGTLSWAFVASAAAALSFPNTTDLHPGLVQIPTGAVNGNNQRMHFGAASTAQVIKPSNIARLRSVHNLTSIAVITSKFGVGVDLSVATPGQWGSAGAWFEFDSATDSHWRTNTRQTSSSTTNTSTVTVTAGNWYQLDAVRLQNGNWQFAINGALVFTHSATLPTTNGTIGWEIQTGENVAKQLVVDFFGMNFAPLGNRWT